MGGRRCQDPGLLVMLVSVGDCGRAVLRVKSARMMEGKIIAIDL